MYLKYPDNDIVRQASMEIPILQFISDSDIEISRVVGRFW